MFIVLCVLLATLGFLYLLTSTKKPANFPPGPYWYPLTGCTKELSRLSRENGGQHKAFNILASKYKTNVLGLKLGQSLAVTVLSYKLVKQILKSEDYDARPDNLFIRLRSKGQKIGITCADGEKWQIQRSFVVKHMRQLGYGKEVMETMIQEELQQLLRTIENVNKSVQIGPFLSSSMISILWALIAGTRISKDDKRVPQMLKLLRRRQTAFDMAGGYLNMFPWLRFVAPEKTGYNLILEMNCEMEKFFMETISTHYAEWTPGRDDDVIFAFISEMHKPDAHASFTEDQLIMICQDIFIAGAQTTSHTLDFAFLRMILHPDVQRKVQEEIDTHVSSNSQLSYSDRAKLPYVEAVIKEVERFCNITPITGPRRTVRDTVLDGYLIPKDTTVLISNYSVHMNEEIWGDPQVFRPERFLEDEEESLADKLIPFGLGRRRCLGDSLARTFIFLFFVGILRSYVITHAPNYPKPTGEPIPGITLVPEEYRVMFTKRHN